jgi:hypothetical protein
MIGYLEDDDDGSAAWTEWRQEQTEELMKHVVDLIEAEDRKLIPGDVVAGLAYILAKLIAKVPCSDSRKSLTEHAVAIVRSGRISTTFSRPPISKGEPSTTIN